MQLYLDSYGAFLNVRNGVFQVTPKHNPPTTFATDDIDVIFLTEGVSATSDAMLLALDKGIPIEKDNMIDILWAGDSVQLAKQLQKDLFFLL